MSKKNFKCYSIRDWLTIYYVTFVGFELVTPGSVYHSRTMVASIFDLVDFKW